MKIGTISLSAILLLTAPVLRAEQSPSPARIAVVSTQRVSVETIDGKAAQARIQALQQERTADLRTKQQALEATRRELAQTKELNGLAPLQRQETQQRADLERASAQAQLDIQNLQRQVSADLQAKLRVVLLELVKARDIQLVLNADAAVLFVTPDFDLTPT